MSYLRSRRIFTAEWLIKYVSVEVSEDKFGIFPLSSAQLRSIYLLKSKDLGSDEYLYGTTLNLSGRTYLPYVWETIDCKIGC